MKTGTVRRKKSVLKITEVNSPLDTGTLQLPPSVNEDDSSRRKRVRFNLEKPQLFTKDELFRFGEVPQEDISLYEMIMQKQQQVAKSRRNATVNSNTQWVYFQEEVAAKINWSEMDVCLCDKCAELEEDQRRANGCKSCSAFLFLEFLDLWTFLVRMDLQIIPDPGDLKAVLKMFNPITEKFDDVQTGKFASIARDEDGVTEVASRQRDIWCYGKLVDETPLPPNSFIRDGRQGGGANNRRRSSLTHCRNLVPTEAPKSDSKYRAKNGIAFTRKQPEEWYSTVDCYKYVEEMDSVGYPHGTLDLLGLFEKYRDLDFLIHRFNSPMYKPKNYLKRFVHADDLDSIQLFFSLLEAESKPFAPMVQRMAEIQIEGKRKTGRTKGKLWKSEGGAEEEIDQSKAFPAGVYRLGRQSIQTFLESKGNAKLFPKRWLKYAAFLGEGNPIEKFADKWNEWRSIYDLCFNSALITALIGSKVEIVDWLLKRDIPDCLKVYDRDREPAMNQRVIYADSYFSRKRRRSMACVSHCLGHQGKLLNLLINMGNRKMANFMIEKGVDVNVSSCSGQVISLEWYPDAYDDSGETVLLSSVYELVNPLSIAAYAAAHRGSYRMVKDLIKAGANPLLCDNAALRACTAVIPGLEGLEYATKKEKKMVRNGALTIKKIMNVMRETKELSQSFCTVYLLYQAVIEKRWDTMVCLSVQPSQAKPQVRRFSFKRDGYIETLSFDSGACAVSLTVIDMLLKTMLENNLASYQRYIIGIVALLEYNQFTLDESRFQDLSRLLLSILSTHGAYEASAVDQLLRLDQFRHFLTLKQEPKWKYRVVTDIIAGKTSKRVKDKTNKRASKSRPKEEVPVTEQDLEDTRSSFIRVPVERPEPLPVTQIISDLLVGLANSGIRSTFETLLNEPVVKQMPIEDKIFSGIAVRAAKTGDEGILSSILTRVMESNKVAARGMMEEAYLAATNSSLNGYCTMNCVEVILRALDTGKKEDEEARNNIFRVAGLKLILRSIRAVLVIIRQRSEYLIRELSKAAVMLYREDNDGVNLNSWILNCLCLQDNISPNMDKINERRKEAIRLRRYVGPKPLNFKQMSVAWYGGAHIMMLTLHEVAPDLVDLGGIAKSWITVNELTTQHFKGKGLALLNHFFPPVTYLHGAGVDCLLNFLCDNWEEILEFLYFLKDSGKDTEKSKQWRKLLSAELSKFESRLEDASTDMQAFDKIVSSIEKQMRKRENGNGEEIGDDSASEGDDDDEEEGGEEGEEWHDVEYDEDGDEVMI